MKKIIGFVVVLLLIPFFIYVIDTQLPEDLPTIVNSLIFIIPLLLVGGLFYLIFSRKE